MINNVFKEKIGEFFAVYQHGNDIELETWTNGGVNMILCLDEGRDESLADQFKERVISFDIDEEIDVHRNDSRYRQDFTITESVKDFTSFKEWLEDVLDKVLE